MNHEKDCDYVRLGIACDCDNAISLSRPVTPHDELLEDIESELSDCGDDCESCVQDNLPWSALRAVVKLCRDYSGAHQRVNEEFENGLNVAFALVIQAIEKELG